MEPPHLPYSTLRVRRLAPRLHFILALNNLTQSKNRKKCAPAANYKTIKNNRLFFCEIKMPEHSLSRRTARFEPREEWARKCFGIGLVVPPLQMRNVTDGCDELSGVKIRDRLGQATLGRRVSFRDGLGLAARCLGRIS
jgi:hypothetical protein